VIKALGSTAPIALLLSRPSWYHVGREEIDSRPIKEIEPIDTVAASAGCLILACD